MKYEKFCNQIIELAGGKENISAVVHCMTRLRFTLKDRSLAKPEEIKEIDGVIDVVSNEVAFQVIIGTHVKDVHAELISILGINNSTVIEKEKKNPIKAVLDLLSESMSPLIDPLLAAGMLAAILSILVLLGVLSEDSQSYIILNSIKTSIFYFLPVFLAMSFAKRLGASPYLAVALAVTLLSSSINGVENLSIFGVELPTITYSNSFFPIILAIAFMGYVNKFLDRIVPKSLQYFFKPALTLIITLPVTLLLFGPIGTWIGNAINFVCTFMMDTFGSWSVVALYAAIQPFLIMLGAGNFVLPVIMSYFSSYGYDPIFMIAAMISDTAVAGAMFGYFLRTKDSKQKQLFGTTGFSALMGVTEPAIYGAFVKFRKPFIAVLIGGGIGGAFAGLMNVKSYALTGLLGITSYIGDGDYNNFYFAAIAVLIGFVVSMITAYILGIPTNKVEQKDNKNKKQKSIANNRMDVSILSSPGKGELVPLNEINDKAFSTGALGKGIGLYPINNIIKSPIDAEVVTVFPTKHAVGLKTENGIEILIHVGIDTVQLNGEHFESFVKDGHKVIKGQPILSADFEAIKQKEYDPTIIVVVTNTPDFLDVIPSQSKKVTEDDVCISVVI
jgi:PTS system beta-glucosides-specific IIC component